MLPILFAILVAGLSGAPNEGTWYEYYEKGINLVENGDGAGARIALEAALARNPKEGLKIPIKNYLFLDYLPHLYLAIALHMTGDVEGARAELQLAERSGVAARSEAGSQLLEGYRVLLRSPAPVTVPPREGPAPRAPRLDVATNRPSSRGAEEYEQLRQDLLVKCGLPPTTPSAEAPWYFHYELGMTLGDRSDPRRSLESLQQAIDRRPHSQHQARMYGMWFTDYRPYYWIARQHAALGNWECVAEALELSRRNEEIRTGDSEYRDLQDLWTSCSEHLQR